ncbi:LptE family protein [Balneolales bacterium ANBcel1]|nr:LptE family protein [Balneolales bacterium ANBcel1]
MNSCSSRADRRPAPSLPAGQFQPAQQYFTAGKPVVNAQDRDLGNSGNARRRANRIACLQSGPFAALLLVLFLAGSLGGCLRYSFTGVSIPSDVRTIYIPFFPDESGSGLGDLSDLLNDALINRFVNETRLTLTSSQEDADVVLQGRITSYSNRPFSVAGDQRASLNRVQIGVRASYTYSRDDEPKWDKNFSGTFEFDPSGDAIDGENEAAFEALTRIADNMFNDAMGDW